MAERLGIRFRPTLAGAAFFFLPLTLLYKGISQTHAAMLIAGIGLPALVLISLLFLLVGAYSAVRTARAAETCITVLPGTSEIGRRIFLETDPSRSRFLPGIRLSVHWKLRFGPFRHNAAAPLPMVGSGSAILVFSRRGEWLGRTFLRAGDPFGFFHLDCPCGSARTVFVPPFSGFSDGSDIPGRPDANSATAPRLREDAEERLERRSYVPGDDPRRLDWKLYARTGDMLVRVGEEGIPFRGRLWLQVVSSASVRFGIKTQIRRLDAVLEAASALVQRLENEGLDVRILLPGEERWAGTEVEWNERLARSLPGGEFRNEIPAPGERLWIIAHPKDNAGRTVAVEALNRGCRVSLGYPAGLKLLEAESLAAAEGLDVRRI